MSDSWSLALICAAATAILAPLYRMEWLRHFPVGPTPTGFGVFFAPTMLLAAFASDASSELIVALAITTGGALLYWIDDVTDLNAWFRAIFSFAIGVALGAIYVWSAGLDLSLAIPLTLLAGLVNLALVNTINFQDGADLNLAVFILLTGALLVIFASGDAEWTPVAAACLAFALPFAAMNSRPQTIYFGDSGSFAFAALFTILGAAFVTGSVMPPPEAAIPAALPVVDMAFVTAYRIRIRQRFTIRHYFHLYQRLQKDQPGFFYLLPQALNVALSVAAAALLQYWGLGRTLSVTLGTAAVTLPVFLLFRHFFVRSEPGPPPRQRAAA